MFPSIQKILPWTPGNSKCTLTSDFEHSDQLQNIWAQNSYSLYVVRALPFPGSKTYSSALFWVHSPPKYLQHERTLGRSMRFSRKLGIANIFLELLPPNTLLCNWERFILTSSANKLRPEVCRSILLLNVHEKVSLVLIL